MESVFKMNLLDFEERQSFHNFGYVKINIMFVYQKALIQTFHTSFLTTQQYNLFEFTALEHKFKR